MVPEADAVAEVGRLVGRLRELCAKANVPERRKLLLTVMEAVYLQVQDGKGDREDERKGLV